MIFTKASVELKDGFPFGMNGWIVIVSISQGVFGDEHKTAVMQYDTRKEAEKTYKLMKNVIEELGIS